MADVLPKSLPQVPRKQWTTHPNFPAHVLLLGSHGNFRRVSRVLVEEAKRGTDPRPLETLYRRWIGGMRSHEAYEEYKLYPYLEKRWGVSFDEASAGHARLHELHGAVLAGFETADEPPEALHLALKAHDAALVEHLRLEEDIVIPLLLSLEPREFEVFTRGY